LRNINTRNVLLIKYFIFYTCKFFTQVATTYYYYYYFRLLVLLLTGAIVTDIFIYFVFCHVSLRSQPPIQWVPGLFARG